MRAVSWRERMDVAWPEPPPLIEDVAPLPEVMSMSRQPDKGEPDPRWRSVKVGDRFRIVGKPTKSCSRNAAYYLRNYNLRFSCKKDGADTIVERIA